MAEGSLTRSAVARLLVPLPGLLAAMLPGARLSPLVSETGRSLCRAPGAFFGTFLALMSRAVGDGVAACVDPTQAQALRAHRSPVAGCARDPAGGWQ
jgi:hypothetical protein